jgi:hypothetical protein
MADPEESSAALGPWTTAELAETARSAAGMGADVWLPTARRFVSSVAKLIRRRRAEDSGGSDPKRPAVFLLHPTPPEPAHVYAPKRVPMLDNGLTTVNGRVWYVSEVSASGHCIDFDVVEDQDVFLLVTESLGLGSIPAIVFDPRPQSPEVRFYPKGLGEPDCYERVPLEDGDVTLDRIFEVVDNVHHARLVTPEAQPTAGKLWRNQRKRWPVENAEDVVQFYLGVGLSAAFPTCTVRLEQPMPEGRLDIEIEQSDPLDPSKVTRHAVLELKVLRSFGETGTPVSDNKTLEWIESGVKQAFAYREGKGIKASALCCFDMRGDDTGESCFEHVRELATSLCVTLKRWYLYSTSKQYRDAVAAARL